MFRFVSMQLDEDNRLLRTHQVRQYADHFDLEGLDLISSKNRVPDPAHSGLDLLQGKNVRLISGSANSRRGGSYQNQSNHGEDQMPKSVLGERHLQTCI